MGDKCCPYWFPFEGTSVYRRLQSYNASVLFTEQSKSVLVMVLDYTPDLC